MSRKKLIPWKKDDPISARRLEEMQRMLHRLDNRSEVGVHTESWGGTPAKRPPVLKVVRLDELIGPESSSDFRDRTGHVQFLNQETQQFEDSPEQLTNITDVYGLIYDDDERVVVLEHWSGKAIPLSGRSVRHAITCRDPDVEDGEPKYPPREDEPNVYPIKFVRLDYDEIAGKQSTNLELMQPDDEGPDDFVCNLFDGQSGDEPYAYLGEGALIWCYHVTGQWYTFVCCGTDDESSSSSSGGSSDSSSSSSGGSSNSSSSTSSNSSSSNSSSSTSSNSSSSTSSGSSSSASSGSSSSQSSASSSSQSSSSQSSASSSSQSSSNSSSGSSSDSSSGESSSSQSSTSQSSDSSQSASSQSESSGGSSDSSSGGSSDSSSGGSSDSSSGGSSDSSGGSSASSDESSGGSSTSSDESSGESSGGSSASSEPSEPSEPSGSDSSSFDCATFVSSLSFDDGTCELSYCTKTLCWPAALGITVSAESC